MESVSELLDTGLDFRENLGSGAYLRMLLWKSQDWLRPQRKG